MGRHRVRHNSGFTLVEALLSVVILGIMATAISGVYIAGLRTLDSRGHDQLLNGALRSQMEILLGQPFADLADGSRVVTIEGTSYTITYTVTLADLDGDSTPEPDAKQITVSLPDRSLDAIVVDANGKVSKI